MKAEINLTGVERFFDDNDIIVSKTDLKGRITYANRTFLTVAGYCEREVLGEPHSIIRHPDMPRCIFKLLWDEIGRGNEIFAYVINRAKNGDHYWVHAHVSPSLNQSGEVIGYHSNRRVPDKDIVEQHIVPLYRTLIDEEKSYSNRKEGMSAGLAMVQTLLRDNGCSYEEFVARLASAA